MLVLASGLGLRFTASGGTVHKLKADLAGKPVLQHTLDAVRTSGLPWHLEDAGHAGMGDSIAAAVRATAGARGWLVLPGDLPLMRAQTLQRMADAGQYPVAVPRYQGVRGHPVRFAAECGLELMKLTGNHGAAQVMAAYSAMNLVANIEIDDIGIVTDIDTLADLQRAHDILAGRQAA